jgi:hypothetical protein
MIFNDIPAEVKIGTRTVPIKIAEIEDSVFGYYAGYEATIYLNSLTLKSRSLAIETFWHELVHAVFDYIRFYNEMVMEMNDKDSPEYDAMKIEERVTESFAQTFLQVIHENDLLPLNNK